jgi:galactitol-specific phosphotransferase system IIB component
MGIGTSVLLKMNAEKVLGILGVQAEVQARAPGQVDLLRRRIYHN